MLHSSDPLLSLRTFSTVAAEKQPNFIHRLKSCSQQLLCIAVFFLGPDALQRGSSIIQQFVWSDSTQSDLVLFMHEFWDDMWFKTLPRTTLQDLEGVNWKPNCTWDFQIWLWCFFSLLRYSEFWEQTLFLLVPLFGYPQALKLIFQYVMEKMLTACFHRGPEGKRGCTWTDGFRRCFHSFCRYIPEKKGNWDRTPSSSTPPFCSARREGHHGNHSACSLPLAGENIVLSKCQSCKSGEKKTWAFWKFYFWWFWEMVSYFQECNQPLLSKKALLIPYWNCCLIIIFYPL